MSRGLSSSVAAGAAAIVIALLVAARLQPTGVDGPGLKATIRTTAHGVPHITADSYADLGFGAGYAYAQQALCEVAGRFVTVRAERSRFFGPDERVPDGPGRASNLESDFFWRRILDLELVEKRARPSAATRAEHGAAAAPVRVRRRLQRVPGGDRRRAPAGPSVQGSGVGPADHREGPLPPGDALEPVSQRRQHHLADRRRGAARCRARGGPCRGSRPDRSPGISGGVRACRRQQHDRAGCRCHRQRARDAVRQPTLDVGRP